jgi:hypothetical protein
MNRRLYNVWIAMLLVCLSAEGLAKGPKAQINIRVIHAVKGKTPSIDPALKDIQAELIDLPFSKFKLLDKLESKIDIGSSIELQFPGDRAIKVQFLGVDTNKDKEMLSLQLSIKPRLNMQLRVANGGRTLLGGPSHKEGILFLDLSATMANNE